MQSRLRHTQSSSSPQRLGFGALQKAAGGQVDLEAPLSRPMFGKVPLGLVRDRKVVQHLGVNGLCVLVRFLVWCQGKGMQAEIWRASLFRELEMDQSNGRKAWRKLEDLGLIATIRHGSRARPGLYAWGEKLELYFEKSRLRLEGGE